MSKEFKTGDRVRRVGSTGPLGTVDKVRQESVRTTIKQEPGDPPGVTVTVLWDNGTLSHFVPEGLDVVESP